MGYVVFLLLYKGRLENWREGFFKGDKQCSIVFLFDMKFQCRIFFHNNKITKQNGEVNWAEKKQLAKSHSVNIWTI